MIIHSDTCMIDRIKYNIQNIYIFQNKQEMLQNIPNVRITQNIVTKMNIKKCEFLKYKNQVIQAR